MKKVIVYTGESIEDKCGKSLHPINEVKRAETLILSDKNETAYSNDPDFIMAMHYIGLKHKIETEFFLNGISRGNNIDPIFHDLNRSLDLINELGETHD